MILEILNSNKALTTNVRKVLNYIAYKRYLSNLVY